MRFFSTYPWYNPSVPYGAVVATQNFFESAVYSNPEFDSVVLAHHDSSYRQRLRAAYPQADVLTIEEAVRYLASNPPDVAQSGDWFDGFEQLLNIRARLGQAFPVLGMIHALNTPQAVLWARYWSAYPGFQAGDGVLCSANADHFLRMTGLPSSMAIPCPLGVDARVQPSAALPEARRKYRFPSGKKVILSLARFDPTWKTDLIPLLRVFKREIFPRHPDYHLVFAGCVPPHVSAHHRQVVSFAQHPQIQFITNFDALHRSDLYASADLFLQVSDNFQETFGLSPREAVRCGVPTIVSDFSGLKAFRNKLPTYFNPEVCKKLNAYPKKQREFLISQTVVNDFAHLPDMVNMLIGTEPADSMFPTWSELRYHEVARARSGRQIVLPAFPDAVPVSYVTRSVNPKMAEVVIEGNPDPVYPLVDEVLVWSHVCDILKSRTRVRVEAYDPFTVMWLWKQGYIRCS